ncbi:MAG TPA: hypothetical protein VEX35_10060 [Allosphingosinicella sp.]|nr:hypothetical protein [Allosphingosinicella sp.]
MVASVLAAGDIAIVSYATDAVGGTDDDDVIRFVLLKPIGAGTQIFFTDRTWNGSAFVNAAGDGFFGYTAGADLAAGTVITITSAQLAAAGMNLSDLTGDTIYVYQGSDADSPTSFLYAADIADGNNVFNGSLANTGLSVGSTAVAIGFDQASYAGQSTQIQQTQLTSISDNGQWHGSDTNDSLGTIYDDRADTSLSGPLNNPDMQLFAVMAGGGQSDAIVRMDNDEASNVATNLTRLFRDNPDFTHLTDLSFDIEDGVFFAVDSDGATTRILKGNIADLVSGTSTPTLTVIYNDATPDQIIGGIEIDTVNNRVYFTQGDIFAGHSLRSVGYGGGAVTDYGPVALAVDSSFGFLAGGVFDFTLDAANDTAYLTYTLVDTFFGPPNAAINYIVKVNSLADPGGGYSIVTIVGSDDPDGPGGNPDNHFPEIEGSLAGIDIDAANQILYFVTTRLGADGTAGIFKLDLATGIYTEIWEQPSNNAFSTLQPFPTTQMQYIEVDTIGGRYYVTTLNSTDTAIGHDGTATDEGGSRIFSGSLTATPGTAPTVFATAFEPTANGAPLGMEIDYAPVLTLSSAGVGYTETAGSPSGAGPPVDVASGVTVSDADQAVIQGATVAITGGFAAGDTLTFTAGGGITGSYDAATGVLSLTGNASFAQYQTVLDSVGFTTPGDNPSTATRTISFTVFDGLINSDPAIATVTVTATNDAPVNTVGAPVATSEDAAPVAVTGLAVSDVDSGALTVTLSVGRGTLAVATVPGGAAVSGSGTGSVQLSGTQAEINTTLAALNGVTYTPTPNVNGPDTLTMTTDDGTDQDVDPVSISVAAVNDAPTVAGDGTEDAAPIAEDTPSATGQSVASLFGGQYSDATDQVAGGSSADPFAGVAVTANGSGAAGQWQYHNGVIWVDIGPASTGAAVLLAASTSVRFNPAPGFSGTAPTLTVHLVDGSAGAIVSGTAADLSVTGGTTRYSDDTVTLSQEVTQQNDPPTGVTGDLSAPEDAVNGSAAGSLTAQDAEGGTHSYVLLDDAGGRFDIDANGNVTVQDGLLLDYEQASSHTITVRVTDDQGAFADFDVEVDVIDVLGENVLGDGRDNVFWGGAEADTLHGAGGNDSLKGGGGGDTLYGGTGSDVLDGGAGMDLLTGGTGGDVFVFHKGEANGDVVMDFKGQGSGGDEIHLFGYAAGTTFTRIGGGNSDLYQINDHGFIEYVTIHGPGHVPAGDVHFMI